MALASAKHLIVQFVKQVTNAMPAVRSAKRSAHHAQVLASVPSVPESLETIEHRFETGAPPDDQPIFVLAAAWRSGSTLLQRLVMSSGEAFLWGEPYHQCSYVQRMADSLRGFSDEWPAPTIIHEPRANGAVTYDDAWVANLFPAVAHLVDAHRDFFRRLYGQPVYDGGYTRWGFKEVRLGIEHARYLRLLFPRARFLFLVRDPYKSYRSYRMFQTWYDRWPDRPIETARDFGEYWRRLAGGFVAGHDALGAPLVRYEEITRGGANDVARLASYLDVAMRAEVLEHRVLDRKWSLQDIPTQELEELTAAVEPLASTLGYAPPGADRRLDLQVADARSAAGPASR